MGDSAAGADLDPAVEGRPDMPKAALWFHAYNLVNTLCWGVVTGVPVMLLLKDLRAGATVFGLLMALPTGLQLLQLWAAPHIDRLGYRHFGLWHWPVRLGSVAALAALAAAAPWLIGHGAPRGAVIAGVLVLLAVFNALRSVSNAAFGPWQSAVIPEALRGTFLGRDLMAGTFGGILVSALSWAVLHWNPPHVYAWLFAVAGLFGLVALDFVRRLPEGVLVARPAAHADSWRTWTDMIRGPFRSLVIFQLILLVGLTGSGVCWVGLLRDVCHLDPGQISLVPMIGAWVALAMFPVVGPVVDRTGSRPALTVGTALAMLHLALWAVLGATGSGHGVTTQIALIVTIQVFSTVGYSLMGLAGTRLLMGAVPEDRRARGFAVYMAVTGIASAAYPVVWGLLFDGLHALGLPPTVNYAGLYAVMAAVTLVSTFMARRLPDPGGSLRTRDFVRVMANDVQTLVTGTLEGSFRTVKKAVLGEKR